LTKIPKKHKIWLIFKIKIPKNMTSAYSQQSQNTTKTWILIFLFVSIVSGFFYAFAISTNNPGIAYIGLLISIGQSFVAYFWGGNLAIASSGGVEVGENEQFQLQNIVENLARTAGIPKPKLFVSPDPSANAFACGRNPANANICVNQGLLDILDKNEIEGVIAHEMSHIKNRDILIMTVTMVLSSVISFLADYSMRAVMWGRDNSDSDDNPQSPLVIVFFVAAIVIAPILSLVIQMAVSRSREFMADATAVTLTRYPQGLISALSKLHNSPVPTEHPSTAMSHFYIAPPKTNWGQKTMELFSTHPPLEARIQALESMN
jgi:heat shock protein HtpX